MRRLTSGASGSPRKCAGIAFDALQVLRVHQRIAVNAHEAGAEFLFQCLERILDEVLALKGYQFGMDSFIGEGYTKSPGLEWMFPMLRSLQ